MKTKRIHIKTMLILALSAAAAGCAQRVERLPDRVTSVSFTPKGAASQSADSGTWVTADTRILCFRSTSFLEKLGLAWETSQVTSGRQPARFALLSPERALELNRQGKGRFQYAPTEDGAAYLLTKAGSVILYSRPQFSIRTDDGRMNLIELSAEAAPDAGSLDVTITASEIPAPPARSDSARKWTGHARIPVEAGRCALIQIPSNQQGRAAAPSKLMVLIVPGSFAWKDGTIRDLLPWGKARITVIEGRELTVKWMPTWLAGMMNDE